MNSRLALITGANTGIGYQTARSLALQGYDVLVAGRSEGKIQWASDFINDECRKSGGKGGATPVLLDLSSFDDVLRFAVDFGLNYDKLDVLICNAGIMNARYHLTGDGFESHFQVNYLSHYLLIRLMLPYLKESEAPRLINVTSMMGERVSAGSIAMFGEYARVKPSDYSAIASYRISKFAQMLLTRHLNMRYRDFLFTAAVHPGIVNSDLFTRRVPAFARTMLKPVEWLGYVTGTLKTPYSGADTSIWLAAEEEPIPSGHYWVDRKERKWPPATLNDHLASDLWDWSGEQVRNFLG